jgi:predicted DNA-binding protein YlxM (UPF0122 family)
MSHKLTSRNAEIVTRYVDDGETLREIGDHFGISHQCVQQVLIREGVVLRKRGPKIKIIRKIEQEQK